MRKPSKDLFELIKSLTKEEKKQCTICLKSLPKQSKIYQKIFSTIATQSNYDEVPLRRLAQVQNFSLVKNRLYTLIMDTLTSHNRDKHSRSKLLYQLQVCYQLMDRKLYDKLFKLLGGVKKNAEQQEEWFLLALIYDIESELQAKGLVFKSVDDEWLHQQVKALEQLELTIQQYQRFRRLRLQVSYHVIKGGATAIKWSSIKAQIEDPLYRLEQASTSTRSRLGFHYVNMINAVKKEDFKACVDHANQALIIFETTPMVYSSPEEHYTYINNAINAAMFIQDLEAVEQLFAKLEQLPQSLLDNDFYHVRILMLQVDWYAITANTTKGLRLLEKVMALDQKDSEYVYFIQYNLARLLFINGSYEQAIDWFDRLIPTVGGNPFYVLRKSSEIVRILAFYEQGEYELVDSLARALYRRLHKHPTLDQAALIFLKGLQHLSIQPLTAHSELLTQLQKELQVLAPEADGLVNYFDYPAWLEAKLSGVDFGVVVRKKLGVSEVL